MEPTAPFFFFFSFDHTMPILDATVPINLVGANHVKPNLLDGPVSNYGSRLVTKLLYQIKLTACFYVVGWTEQQG